MMISVMSKIFKELCLWFMWIWCYDRGHWLVRIEWRPSGLFVCLLLLIFPCTIKSRRSLLAPAHLGGPWKRAIKRLWWWRWCYDRVTLSLLRPSTYFLGAGNAVEENSSIFSMIQNPLVAVSKTLLQQISPVLNWRCRLMQVGHIMAIKR